MIKDAIIKVVNKGDLTYDEAKTVMLEIMSGKTTPTQNAAFLAALSTKRLTKFQAVPKRCGLWRRLSTIRAWMCWKLSALVVTAPIRLIFPRRRPWSLLQPV